MDRVIIGIDPHKLSVTFEARDRWEILRATGCFPTSASGYRMLVKYARQWPDRIWAVEGANGIGRAAGAAQLPAQCRQRQFTGLDAAAGCRPYDRCAHRYSWMREAEAAQQDTVIIGQDDRPDGTS